MAVAAVSFTRTVIISVGYGMKKKKIEKKGTHKQNKQVSKGER